MRVTRSILAGLVAVAAPLSLGLVSAGSAVASTGHHGGGSSVATPFTKTEKIKRVNLIDGKNQVVDKRTVTLNVSNTTNLQGRQEINVSWSGAHPTGGIVADVNSIDAQQEEYPFVLLECRGLDSTKVPASERLSQQTCWTQTWSERYQDTYGTPFPPYRLDRYASVADRAQVVGAPKKLPKACNYLPAPTQHWVPFKAVSGHVYYGGPAGCAGEAPESQDVGGSSLPSNETFGVTGLDGKGSAQFDVWTSAENASLGCTQTVQCSLVAVPIMGISCDPSGQKVPPADQPTEQQEAQAAALCTETGHFAPGQIVTPQGQEDLAVSGSLWWSASNWRNRISVPLTFAVPANACDVVSTGNSIDIYGSELLIQATEQWAPHFCLNPKLFKFSHVQTGEPEARTLLENGSAEAAFTSGAPPGGYPDGQPVVSAPTAITGFAISYVIDGANGQPYTKLRLDPRLLAKLMTESYPAELPIQEGDKALSGNPLNITDDPEFQKLNPGITHGVDATEAASTLLSLSSDSDVMESLTSYINANKQARAWLDGKPDPWGMVVNPNYKNIKLPVDEWPLLDSYEPKSYYNSDTNDCLKNDPVPYLPLVAAPLPRLEEIAEAMQFAIAQSTTVCSQIDGTTEGEKLVALGRQTPGYRFMIGITSLADAHRYGLNTAALETTPNHYVKPRDNSMKAAVGFLQPDAKTGVWNLPYDKLATDSKAAGAYPGTMVVYTAVPTSGLPATDAQDLSELITFAAGPGQTPGLGVGQLPPGFLPMTAANGAGKLSAYSLVAASAIGAQKGATPSIVNSSSTPSTSPSPSPSTSTSTGDSTPPSTNPSQTQPSEGTGPGPTSGVQPTGPGVTSTSPAPGTTPDVAPTTPAAASSPTVTSTKTLAFALGGSALIVMICLALGIFGGVGAASTYLFGRIRRRW